MESASKDHTMHFSQSKHDGNTVVYNTLLLSADFIESDISIYQAARYLLK